MKRYITLILMAILLPFYAEAQGSATYNVISYNIRNSGADDGRNSWIYRREATLNMFRSEKPDLVGMQEVLLDQREFINNALRGYEQIGVGRDDGHLDGECMAIYVLRKRFKVLDSGTYWLSETPGKVSQGWDGACRRTLTWVKLRDRKTRQEIYFFNTHLDHVGRVARRESVLLICHYVKTMVPTGTPVIITGDFNSDLSDSIFRPLEDCGMVSARDTAPVTSHKDSYNGWGKDGSVIDHIFVRDATPLTFRTLDGDYGAPFISDHYPVSLTFRIP